MASWHELLIELQQKTCNPDELRNREIGKLSDHTQRNVIVYYSGWLQKQGLNHPGVRFDINDRDKDGFMAACHRMDKTKGLDLVLHTPGGDMAATESIVHYLRMLFQNNIRAIVPQLAMSGGTMIACACREIVMGHHSSIGPIDPQKNGIPAAGVIAEWNQAKEEILADPRMAALWHPILSKYPVTLVGQCVHALLWSSSLVKGWLETGMFEGDADAELKANRIVTSLGQPEVQRDHARHISSETAKQLGLKIVQLESDAALQDAVLSVHHACVLTLGGTPAFKIIQSQMPGGTYLQTLAPNLT